MASCRCGNWAAFEAEGFRGAWVVEDDCFHGGHLAGNKSEVWGDWAIPFSAEDERSEEGDRRAMEIRDELSE